jgi:hypothetical protein
LTHNPENKDAAFLRIVRKNITQTQDVTTHQTPAPYSRALSAFNLLNTKVICFI